MFSNENDENTLLVLYRFNLQHFIKYS